ncbi:MAG TPA: VOC family protein [Burkholderiales bacterium]|nr:VOC family protein [Burkholderiales bacterium]
MIRLQTTTPATLHHIHLTSADPQRLSGFYARMLDYTVTRSADGVHVLSGGERNLLISAGPNGSPAFVAFALQDAATLARLRDRLETSPGGVEPLATPFFAAGAFALRDPQGRRIAFGVPVATARPDPRPGRLQHVVFQSNSLAPLVEFYVDRLGFSISDEVRNDDGSLAVFFIRSDHEHHSLAFFLGSKNELDHHAYETSGWSDIRDWGDRFARERISMFFGPGRHGPGNNLFFMVNDADGNKLELSAELESMTPEQPPRTWPNTEYTLNTWGQAWMRS